MDANFWAVIGVGVSLAGLILAGRASVVRLSKELHDGLAAVRKETSDGLAAVRREMTEGFAAVREETSDGLAAVRKEMTEGQVAIRKEMTEGFAAVRQEMNEGFIDVREKLADVRERLGTIEGALSIRQAIARPNERPRQPPKPTGEGQPAPTAQP